MSSLPVIDQLAQRIASAYLRRRPHWRPGCSNPRVWSIAATVLLDAHRRDPLLPLDPELFVAAQPEHLATSDPWSDLTQPGAARWYRRRVRQIIRHLRAELRAELRKVARRLGQGQALETVLLSPSRALSPLGRYIAAYQLGRLDLAQRLRRDAQNQHWSCPLYRPASRQLLPPEAYPVAPLVPGMPAERRHTDVGTAQFSLN